jgi:hypothetical protein
VDVLEQRWGAARKIFEQNPQLNIIGVEFVGYDSFKANTVVSDYLAKYGTIDAVWMDAGGTAVTILEAFKDAGAPYPKVMVGEDQEDYLQYWKNNECSWEAYNASGGWTGPMTRGIAYWMMAREQTTDKSIQYQGFPSTGDFKIQLAAHANAPYWVQLGTPFGADIPCSKVTFSTKSMNGQALDWASANASNLVSSMALGFENATQQFFSVGVPDFHPDRENLQPWYGYWLLVNTPDEMTITFPEPIAAN